MIRLQAAAGDCRHDIRPFCDCRVTEEGDWYKMSPGIRNNKGVVDRYRRPKLAYAGVKQAHAVLKERNGEGAR